MGAAQTDIDIKITEERPVNLFISEEQPFIIELKETGPKGEPGTNDYNDLINKPALNYLPLSGGTLTGSINTRNLLPTTTATYTLGDATHYYDSTYIGRIYFNSTSYIDGYASAGVVSATGKLRSNGTNGYIQLGAETDGAEFNLSSNASGTLAIFGAAGATLNVKLLDGSLGINATPTEKLHVAGNAIITGTVGTASSYSTSTFTDRLYVNSTAYLDGATAGLITTTGTIEALGGSYTDSLDTYSNVSLTIQNNHAIYFKNSTGVYIRNLIGIANATSIKIGQLGTSLIGKILILPGTSGNVGIATESPTARLHLPASAAAANSASLKIDPGIVATTPVSGNIESDGTNLYWTNSSGVRKQLNN